MYNRQYAPEAGGFLPRQQRDAARIGYNDDILSPPNILNTYLRYPYFIFTLFGSTPIGEVPQYTSNGADGDAITLGANNPKRPNDPNQKFVAILFGGSTWLEYVPFVPSMDPRVSFFFNVRLGINYNTLKRMYDELRAAGYAAGDIYVLAPYTKFLDKKGKEQWKALKPDGQILEWANDESTKEGMKRAFDWLKGKVDKTTQVFFWSSWGHGTAGTVAQLAQVSGLKKSTGASMVCRGTRLELPVPIEFAQELEDLFSFYETEGPPGESGLPDLEITASSPIRGLRAYLDGIALSLRSTSPDPCVESDECVYTFSLSASIVKNLQSSPTHQVWIDYPTNEVGNPESDCTDRITSIELTLGSRASGPSLGLRDATPSLTITQTNSATLISWPAQVAGWRLETSSSLSAPAWSSVTNVFENSTIIPPNSPQQFFRLSKAKADLAIAGIDTPESVVIGSNLTYAITITNSGPAAASEVTLTGIVPAGATYVSASASQGTCASDSGTVTCSLGTLENGSVATITIVISPGTAGDLINLFTVNSTSSDDNPENNSAIDMTSVVDTAL